MNSSLGDLEAAENSYGYPTASYSYGDALKDPLSGTEWIAFMAITLIICCVGFVGNGCIIWVLGFQMKRNSFTTVILNLAVADFGYLLSIVIIYIHGFVNYQQFEMSHDLLAWLKYVMYDNIQFLMTAISIDRCVAVLFPIWHCCSRPKCLSPTVCAFLWICSFLLLVAVMITMKVTDVIEYYNLYDLLFLVSDVVCLPLITLSTGILFVKVCLKSNQRDQGRLSLTILITLFCFLILALPLSVLEVIISFSSTDIYNKLKYLPMCILLLSCLNASINPVIYFLVGRKKGAQSEKSMKVILQNAFNEDEAT